MSPRQPVDLEKSEFCAFRPLPGFQKGKGQRRILRRCSALCPGNGACVGARVGLHRRSTLRTGIFSVARRGSHFLSTGWLQESQALLKNPNDTDAAKKRTFSSAFFRTFSSGIDTMRIGAVR